MSSYSNGSHHSSSHSVKRESRDSRDDEDRRDERKRKRKSRWGGNENDRVMIPGLPTVLPNNLTREQEKIYLLQVQIEEKSCRLRSGDLGIPANPDERSPSPEPVYNSEGKRLNTREYRTRKKLEEERHSLIQQMMILNPMYKPPADYKAPQSKICEKVIIPQEEYPDINFVGLLIGPRGNTLKSMERDTQSKIIIRGKGSVKEGKLGRKDGQPMPGEDEPLHAFVTGPTVESVTGAVARIREIIRQGIEVPENQNDLRRNQLRELALLNGTLRESDGPRCSNCGSSAHRSWQCPDKPNITNNVTCSNCGGVGHVSRDCKEKKATGANAAKIDEEYLSLMEELGEAPPQPKSSFLTGGSSGGSSHTTTYQVLQPRTTGEAPRSLLPAPPPPSSSSGSGQQSLLPTPASGSHSSDAYAAYGWSATAAAAAYGNQMAYGGWSTQYPGMWSSSQSGVPPPPPPTTTTGVSATAASYAAMYGAAMAPPPPPPPAS